MKFELNDLTPLLDLLAQPAFCTEDGVVCYCNRPARDRGLKTGVSAASLLGAGAELPAPGSAPRQVLLNLHDALASASVLPSESGYLFLLSPAVSESVPPQALLAAAQSIRTPLSNLFAVASSLFPALEEAEDPALQMQVASMNRAYYQLLRLACNLTDMRCVLDGSLHLRREKSEVTVFFRDLFERAVPLCRAAGITLTYSCSARPFAAWMDRPRLERAVWNLLSNAIKFTPKGGNISAELEYTPQAARLRIRDNGDGIGPDLLATAFDAYTRDIPLGDPRWGAGLGLSLAGRVAQLHGGSIFLESDPGSGTSVVLSISLNTPATTELQLRSPTAGIDYTGGYPHELVELSDVLPLREFDSSHIN